MKHVFSALIAGMKSDTFPNYLKMSSHVAISKVFATTSYL